MASRRLSADEAALWARVMAQVRPLAPLRTAGPVEPAAPRAAKPTPSLPAAAAPAPRAMPQRARVAPPSNTLDGTWDRALSRGLASPDRTVDLHGHTLASAHALLDSALDQALRHDERMILLVTGKPPRPASERPHPPHAFRGAIRAAVGDWLAGSRFADRIAAVRAAHPRHGGAGALYLVLRKARAPRKS